MGGGGEGHEDIEEREHEGGTASWEVTRGWGGLKDMGGGHSVKDAVSLRGGAG